jgi:hypothetical protein
VAVDPHRLHFFELDSGAAIQAVDAQVALERAAG